MEILGGGVISFGQRQTNFVLNCWATTVSEIIDGLWKSSSINSWYDEGVYDKLSLVSKAKQAEAMISIYLFIIIYFPSNQNIINLNL